MRAPLLVAAASIVTACEPDAPSPDRTSSVTATARPTTAPRATSAATRPSATAAASAAPAASASAAAPTEWPGDRTVAQLLATATKVKITELLHEGGKVETRNVVVTDKAEIAVIVAAIGSEQRPTAGCARCMPSLTFGFEDATGARIAGVGLFCGEGGVAASTATIRDGLGERCHALAVGKPDELKTLAAKHAAAAASAGPAAGSAKTPK